MTIVRDLYENGLVEGDNKTSQPNERICVEMDTTNPAEPKIKLRQQSWANGMGWFTQKTITASVEEATTLIQELEQATISAKLARSQLHHRKATPAPQSSELHPTEATQEGNLLQFPAGRSARKLAHNPVDNTPGKVLEFKSGKR